MTPIRPVPCKRWRDTKTGHTYGLGSSAPSQNVVLEAYGWTVEWSNGTTGIGRRPFLSEADAQDWINDYNERTAS